MTNKEAIEYFKVYRKIFCEDHLKICPKDSIAYQATLKEKEFYDMAIEALEQEPYTNVGKCEDTISRQAVRDTIFAECSGAKLDIDFAKVLILQRAIKALPSVQLKSGWIPVSEKLPEKGGDYLVTIEWKGSYSGDVYTETNMAVYREKEEEWDCAGIVAWMPLPEPYESTNQN